MPCFYLIWLCPKLMPKLASPKNLCERVRVLFADHRPTTLGRNAIHVGNVSTLRNPSAFLAPSALVLDGVCSRRPSVSDLTFERQPLFSHLRHPGGRPAADKLSAALARKPTIIRDRPRRVAFSGHDLPLTVQLAEGQDSSSGGCLLTFAVSKKSSHYVDRLLDGQPHRRHEFDRSGQDFDPTRGIGATGGATGGRACRKCFVAST